MQLPLQPHGCNRQYKGFFFDEHPVFVLPTVSPCTAPASFRKPSMVPVQEVRQSQQNSQGLSMNVNTHDPKILMKENQQAANFQKFPCLLLKLVDSEIYSLLENQVRQGHSRYEDHARYRLRMQARHFLLSSMPYRDRNPTGTQWPVAS